VSLDSANRSFFACVGIALLLSAYVLCGALGVVLLPLLKARAADRGLDGLCEDAALLFALALIGMVVAGLVRASRSLARQLLTSRRLARHIGARARISPDQLTGAAAQAGLGGRVVLVDAPEVFSFVYGTLTPRVAVSRGLLECASSGELLAVLEHERYHVRNLDPLKLMLVRALLAALPFLPALDSLRAHYLASRELAADRHAIAACGRRPLAGALLKVAGGARREGLDVTASFADRELLNLRLAQLETGVAPRFKSLGLDGVSSLLGLAALSFVLLASASSFGGAAVHRATGAALVTDALLASLSCAAPFVAAGLLAYVAIALRAGRPLDSAGPQAR
jgi:Zn-dependent protease with chaperone function